MGENKSQMQKLPAPVAQARTEPKWPQASVDQSKTFQEHSSESWGGGDAVSNYRIEELLLLAGKVLQSEEKARLWLQTPLVALDGRTPESLLATEEGLKQAKDVLIRIQYGVIG